MWKDIKRWSRITLQDYRKVETRKRLVIAILLLLISVGLVVTGVMRGEVFLVFTKAVHICLECIGLG
jgi:hypothetical protein